LRYFATVTPKEEGSILLWRNVPSKITGQDIWRAIREKGVPLSDHLAQVYDERVQGYCNLDDDFVFDLPVDGSTPRLDIRLTPHKNPTGKCSDTKTETKSVAPVLANPGPMALYAFGFTTLLLMLVDTGIVTGSSISLVVGYAMFHGGLVQLIVGFIEIRRNNLFGATAFTSYGAFWMGWSLTHALQYAGILNEDYPAGKSGYLAIWGIYTAILYVQTLYINYCLQSIFFLLSITFFLLSAGVYSDGAKMAGGIVGILLVLCVFYTATAELYNDMGNIKLPLFHVKRHREEFGNAHAGRGEVLTADDPAGLVPLRTRIDLETGPLNQDFPTKVGLHETCA